MRQSANVTGIQGIKSATHCSIACTQACVGFNFKPGPLAMCELCRVPHDAPNTEMVVDPAWDHYAIIP